MVSKLDLKMAISSLEKKVKQICVVLPTFNEAENIKNTIEQIFQNQLELTNYVISVLVVDDNSPDKTGEIVKELIQTYPKVKLLQAEKKGLGDAYKRGIDFAITKLGADLIIQMDADGQHDPSLIKSFVRLTKQYDVVIGSRFVEGGSTPDFSVRRLFLSKLGNCLVRYLGGAYVIKDCTSGYRVIRREALERCQLSQFPTKGYSFQSWLICELLREGAVVKEMPITFKPRLAGKSKLSFSDQLEFITNILRIRFGNSEDFIKYCIVGSSGVLVNLGAYYFLTRFLNVSLFLSSPIAIEISIITNFLLNNFWTFKNRQVNRSLSSRFLAFHIVAGFAGIINYLCFLVIVYVLIINDILAVLFGIGAGIVFNYAGNSLWTFRKHLNEPMK